VVERSRHWVLRRLVPGSVRARITIASLLVVGVAVLAGSQLFLSELRQGLIESVDQSAELQTERIAGLAGSGQFPAQLDVSVDADERDIAVQVVNGSTGRVVAATPNAFIPPISQLRPRPDQQLTETVRGLIIDPDDNFRIFAEGIPSRFGPLFVYVASELKGTEKALDTVEGILRKGALALLALVGALTWVLVGRALRPVESIRRQVDEISEAALHRRVPEPASEDEIARLARTMNAMLDRLETSSERQHRFVADASHELRSPLASTRAQLEVAVAHPETARWPTTASVLLEENQRMERLVADLLFLARQDGSKPEPRVEPVDVDDLVLAEVGRLRDRGRVTVDISAVTAARVDGDPEQLGRVVRNLLENAERHARATTRVELHRHNGEVELVVADDGPGVLPADRERIFYRFTRLDPSRSRHDGGAGLGLAIAREIVSAHGGRIWAEDPPAVNGNGAAPGARFVVRLPLGV
jgi:signal transduction histidine kinase